MKSPKAKCVYGCEQFADADSKCSGCLAAAHFEAVKAHAKRAREALEALGDLGLVDWGNK